MRDEPLHIDSMPEEIQRLCGVMSGLDPMWTLEAWLKQQATMAMELISSDIAREKKISEQRLKRLEDIAKRLNPSTAELIDSGQRNLFDCFDLDYDKSMLGLGARAVDSEESGLSESHPVNTFLELLPDSQGDDPLLAVACQLLLMTIESEIAKGEPVATLGKIVSEMDSRGVSYEEIDEALEHLLMNGSIVEIDDDCFILI
ncbi:MAG: hypothetical protein HN794_05320 [Euryarchaeota archaeon]|jgi:hypothetical protein|nr:hypothetical protein [Euryarchaeota archaeon]MBT4924248.1 hypothetical protein [Euryarchaeota archaeon]MBT5735247.1 hypothetical protein [Euryarchaeota archaeon]MBT7460444.1 hypothetical protein [Euryarchaeota archaeon]